ARARRALRPVARQRLFRAGGRGELLRRRAGPVLAGARTAVPSLVAAGSVMVVVSVMVRGLLVMAPLSAGWPFESDLLHEGADGRIRVHAESVHERSPGSVHALQRIHDRHVVGIRDALEAMPVADQNLVGSKGPSAIQSPNPMTHDLEVVRKALAVEVRHDPGQCVHHFYALSE